MGKITLADIADAIGREENYAINSEQYHEFIMSIPWRPLEMANLLKHDLMTVMGKPVIKYLDWYVVFVRCVYCGCTDGKIDSYKCCGHCGGEIIH
jgi:hypothetical protein